MLIFLHSCASIVSPDKVHGHSAISGYIFEDMLAERASTKSYFTLL